jgi:hypothetical protein
MKPVPRSLLLPLCALLPGAVQSGGQVPDGDAAKPPPGAIRAPTGRTTMLPGQPAPEGDSVLDAPQPVGAPVLTDSQPLALDAVIASETFRLVPLHFRNDVPIAVGAPFNATHPAGTDFRRLIRDGTTRYCVVHRGVYRPVLDENGAVYPGFCVEDRDGDGRYETAVLEPYDPEHAPVRTFAIAPVGFEPNPSMAADDPQAIRVKRRIRVTFVGPSEARVAAEQGLANSLQADVTSYFGRPAEVVTLPLRDGASGSLGGVDFRLMRSGAGWSIAATGRLQPWLEIRDNGSLIAAGGLGFRRHAS